MKYDLDIDTGLTTKITKEYKLAQIIKILMLTAVGSKISDPLSGCSLSSYLYKNNYIDPSTIATIVQSIEKQIIENQDDDTIDEERLVSLIVSNIIGTETGIDIYLTVLTKKNQNTIIVITA